MKEIEGIDASTYAGKAAKACKTKVRGIMGDDLLTFTLLDFVSLMMLNNKFLDKDIIITDDNREECYIKIIEMGDDSLIDDLEHYINLRDSIKEIEKNKTEYHNVIHQIKQLTDYDNQVGVNSVVEEYLRR